MKKLLLFLVGALVLGAVGWIGYSIFTSRAPAPDVSKLPTVEVNGAKYKTTGSIPLEDTSAITSSNQIIKLANLRDITTSGYKITVDQSGKVQITLYPPYDQNKTASLNWLKDSGFAGISQTDIVFTNSSK